MGSGIAQRYDGIPMKVNYNKQFIKKWIKQNKKVLTTDI